MDLLALIKSTNTKISNESYKRFAKYFKATEPDDREFDEKVRKIYDLIINENVDDINLIVKESGCRTFEECVLKIRYLKNKRIIGDYYIDLVTKTIKKCSEEDQKLLEKYSGYIYIHHLQIDEITVKMPTTTNINFQAAREQVFNDIVNLYDKGLLNGIILNKVDRFISYYTLDKRLQKELISKNCPNCGAINEMNRYSKVRCLYCNTIIADEESNYINQ